MRILLVLMVFFLLVSCGTMRTIGETPPKIEQQKYTGSQPCEKINRIYSGVQYDYCVVFMGDESDWELEGYLTWDFPFSFLLDTIFLPYTIYKQATSGHLNQGYPGTETNE